MWILVMLMVTVNGPMVQAHPKPMSEAECNQAKVTTENQLGPMLAKKGMKATFACIAWNSELPSETDAPAKPEAPEGDAN